MEFSKISQKVYATTSKCKDIAANAIIDKVAKASEQGKTISGFWKKMNLRAQEHINNLEYQSWKQKIDEIFPKVKSYCDEFKLKDKGHVCFCAQDKYDDFVRIRGSRQEMNYHFSDFISAISDKSKDTTQFVDELRKLDEVHGVGFLSTCEQSKKEMREIFAKIIGR